MSKASPACRKLDFGDHQAGVIAQEFVDFPEWPA